MIDKKTYKHNTTITIIINHLTYTLTLATASIQLNKHMNVESTYMCVESTLHVCRVYITCV